MTVFIEFWHTGLNLNLEWAILCGAEGICLSGIKIAANDDAALACWIVYKIFVAGC